VAIVLLSDSDLLSGDRYLRLVAEAEIALSEEDFLRIKDLLAAGFSDTDWDGLAVYQDTWGRSLIANDLSVWLLSWSRHSAEPALSRAEIAWISGLLQPHLIEYLRAGGFSQFALSALDFQSQRLYSRLGELLALARKTLGADLFADHESATSYYPQLAAEWYLDRSPSNAAPLETIHAYQRQLNPSPLSTSYRSPDFVRTAATRSAWAWLDSASTDHAQRRAISLGLANIDKLIGALTLLDGPTSLSSSSSPERAAEELYAYQARLLDQVHCEISADFFILASAGRRRASRSMSPRSRE